MTISRQFGLVLALIAIVGAVAALEMNSMKARPPSSGNSPENSSGGTALRAPEITNPSGFINAEPFKLADLAGKKVILVDFWTYSCINCQRTIPYLSAWYKTYKDQGLEIVGVHTPEFDFEKKQENVAAAVAKYGIQYPVVLDSDYGTWTAYGNRYWPRKYLIDIDGKVVYDHVGEGGYEETEEKIRELLAAAAGKIGAAKLMPDMAAVGPAEAPSSGSLSPETYFGAARNAGTLGNGQGGKEGSQTFAILPTLLLSRLQLGGTWNITPEYAQTKTGSVVLYRFRAKRVYMVLESGSAATAQVLLDGKALGASAGKDVVTATDRSTLQVKESRLYDLVNLPEAGEHVLEIRFSQPGVNVYTFTFG